MFLNFNSCFFLYFNNFYKHNRNAAQKKISEVTCETFAKLFKKIVQYFEAKTIFLCKFFQQISSVLLSNECLWTVRPEPNFYFDQTDNFACAQ